MREILALAQPQNEHEYALEKKRFDTIGEYSYGRFVGRERELLDAEEEIGAYIDSWDIWDKSNTELLYEDIEHDPLPRNLSAYVIVPVAAGQETESLEATLAQYARQDADPSTWALMLYVNNVDPSENILPSDLRRTDEIIEQFKTDNPHLSVRVVKNTYCDDAPPIGAIRATAWDTALLDVQNNGLAHDNLIGISHDADAPWISPNYISEMQRAAVEHPEADLLTCKLSWQTVGDPASDANKFIRYWEYLGYIQHHKLGRVSSYDANTAIRMSSYAAIGGYRHHKVLETRNLRNRLLAARNYPNREPNGNIHYIDTIRLKTNSRRLYQAFDRRIFPGDAWTEVPFLTGEDPARLLDATKLANQPLAEDWLREILKQAEDDHLSRLDLPTRRRLTKLGRQIIRLPQIPTKKIERRSIRLPNLK